MLTKIKTDSHDEWKALRRKYIGGSDAGAVVGLNGYESAYSLWAEKTGKIPEFEGNLASDVGTYLEDFIAKKFEAETGKKVRRANQSIVNDRYPWAIANIDRDIVGEDAGLECKSTSELNLKRFRNGEFPTQYYCQCVHYLGTTEKKRWYLAVLIGNRDFRIYMLTRIENDTLPSWCEASVYVDDDEIASLMGEEDEFWNGYVLTNTPPPVDGKKPTSDTLSAIYPKSNEDTVNLYTYGNALTQYVAISTQIKELEEAKDKLANEVKAFLGEAGKGETDKFKVSWATQERNTFDSKRFAKDHPELDISGYYNKTTMRPFKVTEKKEK